MNDDHIDKMLSQGFSGDPLGPELKQTFLEQSSRTLARTTLRRRWTGRAGYAAILLLVLLLGFAGGRSTTTTQSSPTAMAGRTNTVEVVKDLVTWLEAARLFTQLDMEKRAAFAYEQAGQLAPRHNREPLATAATPAQNGPLSNRSRNLARLMAHCETQPDKTGCTRGRSDQLPSARSLLAQSIGE